MAPPKPSKPILPPLKTPKNMSFPSELHDSPLTGSSENVITIKREPGTGNTSGNGSGSGTATPITPPQAYTDFLKALTPIFSSPVSAGVNFPKYPFDKLSPASHSVPTSATSVHFPTRDTTSKTTSISLPPPSPARAPQSAREPAPLKRLRIPTSFVFSPATDSPHSARTIRSPFSPSDWKIRYLESPRSAGPTTVSVRQVVTRTVTYKRTQLDPPPKGKRRKTGENRESCERQDS